MKNVPPKFTCTDCRDTGVMTVTLWGVRDTPAGRYEREDRPCRCPLGVDVRIEEGF